MLLQIQLQVMTFSVNLNEITGSRIKTSLKHMFKWVFVDLHSVLSQIILPFEPKN